ncbi:MAG: metallophosphoesterase, partial [Rhodospirillales bacterium]|nr:metallophosphoesterase [Rhodospirillales bacterium]
MCIAMPQRALTWLHLSDLHLCQPGVGWQADRILKALKTDLEKLRDQEGLWPNLIFVTGDLAFGNFRGVPMAQQFARVAEFLEAIRDIFQLPRERVFVVPGNHDVDRNAVHPALLNHPDSWTDAREVAKWLERWDKNVCNHFERLIAYKAFIAKHLPHQKKDSRDSKRFVYGFIEDIDSIKVGIAGFNSAWTSGRDNEHGKLWLGGRWQHDTLYAKVEDAEVRIALSHHPASWLHSGERAEAERSFTQDYHFHLHGHEHDQWVMPMGGHVRIAAGACYGETEAETGYSMVRLDPDTWQGKVWLRAFYQSMNKWGPRVIPGKADQGVWSLALQFPPRSSPSRSKAQTGIGGESDPSSVPFNQLPPDPLDFIGRQKEVDVMIRHLRSSGKGIIISSVNGLDGIGKTSLATHVAHKLRNAFPGGQFFINLQGASEKPLEPRRALEHFILSLDLHAKIPEDIEQVSALYRNLLSRKQCLVVLDNAASAAQIRLLLPPKPCAVIVTSRNRFDIDGIPRLDLDLLTLDEAAKLLRSFVSTERCCDQDLQLIAELCGHLPLALRMTGAILRDSGMMEAADFLFELRGSPLE